MNSPTIVKLPPAPDESPSSFLHDEDASSLVSSIHPSPRLSSSWQPDPTARVCTSCHRPFDAFQRRHHCRLCGMVFCQSCSDTRSLIPPTALVLRHHSAQDVSYVSYDNNNNNHSADNDVVSNIPSLEHRIRQARHPQRTCRECRIKLAPLQEELREKNSNAVRFNYVDASGGARRMCNSPLAFTLGHEVRKAAYALGNLLPDNNSNGRVGGGGYTMSKEDEFMTYPPRSSDPMHHYNNFKVDVTLKNLDGMHVPGKLLRKAKGIAIITCAKGGLGFAGIEFGTGLVVARLDDGNQQQQGNDVSWSAPSAICIGGFAWGALIGAQVSDHIFLLMTEEAVRLFSTQDASVQLGVDIGVAVGPMGRSAEADLAASRSNGSMAMAPIYTYSLSKGLYAGVSMEGKVVLTRPRVNEKFYGMAVRAEELLNGSVPRPPAAQPLYDAIRRCLVYSDNVHGSTLSSVGSSSRRDESSLTDLDNGTSHTINPGPAPGGLLERLSHSTGLGMPVATPPARTDNPYNLQARYDPTWQPNFSE